MRVFFEKKGLSVLLGITPFLKQILSLEYSWEALVLQNYFRKFELLCSLDIQRRSPF